MLSNKSLFIWHLHLKKLNTSLFFQKKFYKKCCFLFGIYFLKSLFMFFQNIHVKKYEKFYKKCLVFCLVYIFWKVCFKFEKIKPKQLMKVKNQRWSRGFSFFFSFGAWQCHLPAAINLLIENIIPMVPWIIYIQCSKITNRHENIYKKLHFIYEYEVG